MTFFGMMVFMFQAALAQEPLNIYLKWHQGKEQQYIESLHQKNSCMLEGLNRSYDFYITFNVSSDGILSQIRVVDIPFVPVPDQIKEYAANLFQNTSGLWAVNSNHQANKIVYRINLLKRNQTMEERLNDSKGYFEYFMSAESKDNLELKEFSLGKNTRYLGLYY